MPTTKDKTKIHTKVTSVLTTVTEIISINVVPLIIVKISIKIDSPDGRINGFPTENEKYS